MGHLARRQTSLSFFNNICCGLHKGNGKQTSIRTNKTRKCLSAGPVRESNPGPLAPKRESCH